MEYSKTSLLSLFEKYYGLFSLKNKIKIADGYTLSLAYTPGVGACCKEIEKDLSDAYLYTNKGNSILVITDSSGFPDYDPDDWNYYIPIPYLECQCVYYKTQANIDAYPIVLDHNLIHNEDDLLECLVQLAPAYSGFELYNISRDRLRLLKKKINALKSKLELAIYSTEEAQYTQYKIMNMGFTHTCKIDPRLVSSMILRAALFTRTFGFIGREVIDCVFENIKQIHVNQPEAFLNFYQLAHEILYFAAQFFIKHDRNNDKEFTLEDIEQKYNSFLIEGKDSWIEPLPTDFDTSKLDTNEKSLLLHKRYKGMIEMAPKIEINDPRCLDQLFSLEQISQVAEKLKKNKSLAWEITCKRNLSAIITNGTAILGFGAIGSLAGLPVMEGKSMIFQKLGGVDLVPLCVLERDPQKFIDLVSKIQPIFSAINLEDIKAPECFEMEQGLIKKFSFPIFHDDQHGTAIVTIAGLLNGLKLVNKKAEDIKVVINGGGAAGNSIIDLLRQISVKHIICCDTKGAIYKGRKENMNKYKDAIAEVTNQDGIQGNLAECMKGCDVFIGVSAPSCVTKDMVASMAEKAIVFALANPVPEIYPTDAKEAGAYIVATGRSDFDNQVNNCLAFPGIFRAVIDIRAKQVTLKMKLAASFAIAESVPAKLLCPSFIIPKSLDSTVQLKVARNVAQCGIDDNLCLRKTTAELVQQDIQNYFIEGTLQSLIHHEHDNEKKIL